MDKADQTFRGFGGRMSVTEVLKREHRVIERMLNILKVISHRLETGEDVNIETLRGALDFVRMFADRCHHGKEEDILFRTLEGRGVLREGGPIGMMLIEHDEGRKYVRGMAEALERYEKGDSGASRVFATNTQSYVELLTQHMFMEDNILYTMAESVLGESEKEKLLERFRVAEKERLRDGAYQKYIKLVQKLEKDLGWGRYAQRDGTTNLKS